MCHEFNLLTDVINGQHTVGNIRERVFLLILITAAVIDCYSSLDFIFLSVFFFYSRFCFFALLNLCAASHCIALYCTAYAANKLHHKFLV